MSTAEPRGLEHTFLALPRTRNYLSDFRRVSHKNIAFCLPLVWSRMAPAGGPSTGQENRVGSGFAGGVPAWEGRLEENS
jgi:hypothetical protein